MTAVPFRLPRLDALRGAAMLWMAAFHLSFDLNHFGYLKPAQNFYRDPFWLNQRTCILSLFLFCAGLAQAATLYDLAGKRLAERFTSAFWMRWAQIVFCALLVSAGSAIFFPKSWIGFGVLHGIAVMLVLARLMAGFRVWLWPIGALAVALPWLVQHSAFDTPYTQWIGLVTRKPITEDWVPVLPWLGVMLFGLAAGQWLLHHRPAPLAGPLPDAMRPLAELGRWSLSFYMAHQPVFFGLILGGRALEMW